jgi:hypothetical protein
VISTRTFSTTGMEHSPDERDGHRMGTHAVARDAAGGVGRAAEGRAEWLGRVPRRSARRPSRYNLRYLGWRRPSRRTPLVSSPCSFGDSHDRLNQRVASSGAALHHGRRQELSRSRPSGQARRDGDAAVGILREGPVIRRATTEEDKR